MRDARPYRIGIRWGMASWMLEAPSCAVTDTVEHSFRQVLATRDLQFLPSTPLWVFLQWLAQQGFLLHGSPQGGLHELRPGDKAYGQPDEFSNIRGVYAASDGLWALMYALHGPNIQSKSDMGLRLRLPHGQWSEMRYFLSVAPRDKEVQDPRALLAPGFVYVLERQGFAPSPPYEHPGLGFVQEAHWVNPGSVRPLLVVPVSPADFVLPIRLHDADVVAARAKADPWGFPWLDSCSPPERR